MPRRSHAAAVHLEILVPIETRDEREVRYEALPPDSERYQITEQLIHNALSLLETEDGRESLVAVSKGIIKEKDQNSRLGGHLFVGRDAEQGLPFWIDQFLRCMRRSFPVSYIEKTLYNADAQHSRRGAADSLAEFNPRVAGTMHINRKMINNMMLCHRVRVGGESEKERQEAESHYARYKFYMTITIAHEIVHFLSSFISGQSILQKNTPPKISVQGYGTRVAGEAGRYWERHLLGGIVESYEDKSLASNTFKGAKQAGDLYLIENGKEAWHIPMSYIYAFNDQRFRFPIAASRETEVKRGDLGLGTVQMSDKRNRARYNEEPSPPRDADPTMTYRRAPHTQPSIYYHAPAPGPEYRPSSSYAGPSYQSAYSGRPQGSQTTGYHYAEPYYPAAAGSSSRPSSSRPSSSQPPTYYSSTHHDSYYYDPRRR